MSTHSAAAETALVPKPATEKSPRDYIVVKDFSYSGKMNDRFTAHMTLIIDGREQPPAQWSSRKGLVDAMAHIFQNLTEVRVTVFRYEIMTAQPDEGSSAIAEATIGLRTRSRHEVIRRAADHDTQTAVAKAYAAALSAIIVPHAPSGQT